jgi:hypothetical protein
LDYATVDVSADFDGSRRWIIAEAFWAAPLVAPSLTVMTGWLAEQGGLPRIVSGIGGGWLNRLRVGLILSALATVFLLSYGLVRGFLQLIPFTAGLQSAVVRPFDTFLTQWAGDMWVLLRDPLQASQVRARVQNAIGLLERLKCQRIVVIAHSGGAVVSFLAIATQPVPSVSRLVTFGEGLNVAWRLVGLQKDDDARTALMKAGSLAANLSRMGLIWDDFHASEDPVPAGPLNVPSSVGIGVHDHEVWNYLSPAEDHGGYWDNTEEFVLPLAQILLAEFPAVMDPDGRGEPGLVDRVSRLVTRLLGDRRRDGQRALVQLGWTPEDLGRASVRRRGRVLSLAMWRRVCLYSAVGSIAFAWLVQRRGPIEILGDQMGDVVSATPIEWAFRIPVDWWREAVYESWLAQLITALGAVTLFALGALLLIYLVIPISIHFRPPIGVRWSSVLRLLDYGGYIVLAFPIVTAITGALHEASTIHVAGAPRIEPDLVTVSRLAGFGLLAILAVLIAAIVSQRLRQRIRRWLMVSGLTLAMLFVLALPLLLLAAVVADPKLSRAALGALAVFLAFGLLRSIGEWRWGMWDRAEREKVLRGTIPHGGFGILVEGTLLIVADVLLLWAFGSGDTISRETPQLLIAGGLVIVVSFVGVSAEVLRARSGAQELPSR